MGWITKFAFFRSVSTEFRHLFAQVLSGQTQAATEPPNPIRSTNISKNATVLIKSVSFLLAILSDLYMKVAYVNPNINTGQQIDTNRFVRPDLDLACLQLSCPNIEMSRVCG
jgi:hypothetical protein